ncbi:hypothetical protein N657DRAFT_178443 [Parathielavia appendiculata]|uniref:Uncharacterized protein n=1 Tax=Parathielavia appendiculata TaxID=2587402 RepID=A0AAN6Z6X7_9PEZI|nr:hypothetical protein N657DRAFT_178443 [Parathielavia appendiculata]
MERWCKQRIPRIGMPRPCSFCPYLELYILLHLLVGTNWSTHGVGGLRRRSLFLLRGGAGGSCFFSLCHRLVLPFIATTVKRHDDDPALPVLHDISFLHLHIIQHPCFVGVPPSCCIWSRSSALLGVIKKSKNKSLGVGWAAGC